MVSIGKVRLLLACWLVCSSVTWSQEIPEAPAPNPWLSEAKNSHFLVPTSIDLLAAMSDAELTHQGLAECHRSIEGNPLLPHHPSRAQLYRFDLTWWAGFSAVGLIARRFHIHGLNWGLSGADTTMHVRGALSWRACI